MNLISNKIPVILLDIDLRPMEGIISSFGKRNIHIIAISSKKNPIARYSKYIKQIYNSPSLNNEKKYLNFLLEFKLKGVLLYSSDSSAKFVSKYKERLTSNGYLVNIPDYNTFIKGFDKYQLSLFSKEVNVPVIPTMLIEGVKDLDHAFNKFEKPFVLKGTRLAGGKFYIVNNMDQINEAYRSLVTEVQAKKKLESGIIAQELIKYDYDEIYNTQSFYNRDGEAIGFIELQKFRPNIKRNGQPGSRMFAGRLINNEELRFYTKRLLDNLNWKGFASVDWIYSKKYKSFLLCEINPRLPGFSNLLVKMRFDSPFYYYNDFITNNPKPLNVKTNVLYFEIFRIQGDFFGSLIAVFKGHLSFKNFIKSYLKIFSPKSKVIFDVFVKDDLKFTFVSWVYQLLTIIKK